ncbi:putative quinol monooxygenase [Paraglaciecola sp.]|uniref:putative quinol monooxygenase n=1 Tax=Paraglaciecola sp. TaxID=1920173 RepID=UPI003EF4A55F
MYVVTVKFDVKPNRFDEFLPLMLKQADDSLSLEENCLQFDVSRAEDKPTLIYLYEIYRTKEDFSAHLATPHFLGFATKVGDMVIDKQVECFETFKAAFN